MREPGRALWIQALASLQRREHRDEIVGDLLEERAQRVARGQTRPIATLWLASHLLRSSAAGWTIRGPLITVDDGMRSSTAWRRGLGQDVRYAIRRLVARPGSSLVAVLTLTIGIGLTAGMFGVVNAVVFKTPSIPAIDRVVTVHPASQAASNYIDLEFPVFETLADLHIEPVASVGGASFWLGAVTGPDRAELLSGELVSARYFETLQLTPRAGTFALSDGERSPRQAVVISDRLWDRWFDRDQNVIGSTLVVAGDPLTIVGIAPEGFNGISLPAIQQMDLWLPYGVTPRIDGRLVHSAAPQIGMATPGVRVMARLRDQVGIAAAAAAFASIGERIDAATFSGPASLTVSPLRRSLVPADLEALATKLGAGFSALAALVLLIACSNLANLLLADVLGRRSELAIRLMAGATRGHLVRSVLTETLILTGLGFASGLGLAIAFARVLASVSRGVPIVSTLQVYPSPDWRVVTFSAAIALVAGASIGAGPAWRASRSSPAGLLQAGGLEASGGGRRRQLLVIAQVAACTVLLIVASLFVRSAVETMEHDPGFDASRMAMVRLDLAASGLNEVHGRRFLEDALDLAGRLPAARRTLLTTNFPLGFAGQRAAFLGDSGSPGQRPKTIGQFARVSAGFLEVMHVPIVAGRTLSASDDAQAPHVAVINERTAAALWPDGHAVGRRIALSSENAGWWEVVGIARDTDANTPGQTAPLAYIPFDQAYQGRVAIAVETAADPAEVLAPLRAMIRRLDPGVVVTDANTVAADQARVTQPIRLAAAALAGLGAVALTIAVLGLYAVAAHTVKSRTREIGVRMALGASRGAVRSMVLRQSLAMILGGVVPGLTIAFIAVNVLRSALFGIGAHDPLTFIGVPVGLVVVGVVATMRPAGRAARIDPTVALREL
jgi:predicted permease